MEAQKHHKFLFLIITYLSDHTGLVTLGITPAYYILLSNPSQKLLGSSPERLWIYGGIQQHHGSEQGNGEGNSQHQKGHSENSAAKGAARNEICTKAISSAGFKVLQAGASLSPSVPTTRPLTSVACDETSVLFTGIGKHAFAVSFFPQMCEALLSVIFQIVR